VASSILKWTGIEIPHRSPISCEGPWRFTLVEKLVCELHIQIFTDERYLVDFHVQVRVERWYDMQFIVVELGQQHIKPHGPNKVWVNWNLEIVV
jgi:hypothetical protein